MKRAVTGLFLRFGRVGRVAVMAIAAMAVIAPIALANSSAILATRATLSESVQINTDRIKFQTKDPTDFQMQTITFTPGGNSGWHHHPGILWVLVESGAVTIYDQNCEKVKTVTAGNVFVESGSEPMIVRNDGSIDAVVDTAQAVPKGEPFRVNDYVGTTPPCQLPTLPS